MRARKARYLLCSEDIERLIEIIKDDSLIQMCMDLGMSDLMRPQSCETAGNSMFSLETEPYLELIIDKRVARSVVNRLINRAKTDRIERLLIFEMTDDGAFPIWVMSGDESELRKESNMTDKKIEINGVKNVGDGDTITVIIDGTEYSAALKKIKPRTGYERVDEGKYYYRLISKDSAGWVVADGRTANNEDFNRGDYHNDKQLAKDNARADELMRRLRQWQALNDKPVDWSGEPQCVDKYFILFDRDHGGLDVGVHNFSRYLGAVYFSTEEVAEKALLEFRDELMWYFTEYRPRLDEPKYEK